jgi:hypothetical protein
MKLTRNIKLLIILVFSAYFIELSNCLQTETLLKNSNSNSNANKVENANTNTASAENANNAAIFSMKHKKMHSSSTTKKATTTSQTNTKAKAATAATTKTQAKKTQTQTKTETKKQPMTDNLMGADSDLLKQTGLLAAAMAAGNKPPSQKKRIDLEKMGPIAFHSWVKFFKYNDQTATDKMAKIKLNQSRKFFNNGEFREQLKLYPGQDYQEKGDDGEFKYVSDPQKFYLIAFKNLAVFYSSKIVN